jgi:ABC-type multidrug transport system fused ATPase/permease subunit
MIAKMLERIQNLRVFLGRQVIQLYFIAFCVGVLWFTIESSFVFILQGFFFSLGIMPLEKTMLPVWYPQSLILGVFILFGFGLIRSLLNAAREFSFQMTKYSFIRYQRTLIFRYSINHAHEVEMSTLVTIFNERMNQAGVVLNQVSVLINSGIAFILFFVFGMYLAPTELLIGLGFLLVLMMPFGYFNRLSLSYGKSILTSWDEIFSSFVIGLKNHFLLKVYNLVDLESERAGKMLTQIEQVYRKHLFFSALRYAYPQFAGIVTICLMTFVGLQFLHTPGVKLLALFYIFVRLAQSASELHTSWGEVQFNKAGFYELFHWFIKATAHEQQSKQKIYPDKLGVIGEKEIVIDIQNIDFSYTEDKKIFHKFSLQLKPSVLTLIKGQSGSGKSTLVSLILGLIHPTNGRILINGLPLQSVRESYLPLVGYVAAEPFLIPDTIRRNLLYGHPNPNSVSDDEIWEALKIAQIDQRVSLLSKTLDEKLNEFAQLSTGEKQRLSIARALLRKPKLLILDEATANLDIETELKFVDVLEVLKTNLTVIVISHKDQFEMICDQIVQLDELNTNQKS